MYDIVSAETISGRNGASKLALKEINNLTQPLSSVVWELIGVKAMPNVVKHRQVDKVNTI